MVSAGGSYGLKAKAFPKRFVKLHAKEEGEPCSIVRIFVNPRMRVACVRVAHVRVENPCIPVNDMSNYSRCEGGTGL